MRRNECALYLPACNIQDGTRCGCFDKIWFDLDFPYGVHIHLSIQITQQMDSMEDSGIDSDQKPANNGIESTQPQVTIMKLSQCGSRLRLRPSPFSDRCLMRQQTHSSLLTDSSCVCCSVSFLLPYKD